MGELVQVIADLFQLPVQCGKFLTQLSTCPVGSGGPIGQGLQPAGRFYGLLLRAATLHCRACAGMMRMPMVLLRLDNSFMLFFYV